MKETVALYIIIIISIICTFAAPFVGMEFIDPYTALQSAKDTLVYEIFWKIRAPRVIVAFLSGASLSLCGMCFQALFRNPLADPFTLGISSGAAFGAALAVQSGVFFSFMGIDYQSLCSFAGAFLSLGIVYGLTKINRGFSVSTMLLAGVAVSFFFSSLILFIQYMSDFSHSFRIVRWMMGGIEGIGYKPVIMALPITVIGSFIISLLPKELNLISFGEEIAVSRGVNSSLLKTVLFFTVSIMVGNIVAVTGPIGFIGLMCPHICRLIVGFEHRKLIPATFFFGGLFLVVCDTIARTVIAPAEIPVGIITSMIGGPFFLWLLLKRGKNGLRLN